MDKYIFDSYALIAFFRGEPESIKIAGLLAELSQQNLKAQMVSVMWAKYITCFVEKGIQNKLQKQ